MDITALSKEEIEELIRQANQRLAQFRLDEHNAKNARTTRIEDSITALDGLLGPSDVEPGTDSIRAVLGFDGQTMADNADIALPLAFQGLELLTKVVRDIAVTVA